MNHQYGENAKFDQMIFDIFTEFGGVGAGSPVRKGGEVEPPRTAAGGTLSGPGAALTALALTEQS